MNEILNFLFQQYGSYSQVDIGLEIFAVFFGFLSVWFSKNNNVLVFPTGLINTSIFVYLLFKWELLGDMIINAYYFVVSIYGWYYWTRKNSNNDYTPISKVLMRLYSHNLPTKPIALNKMDIFIHIMNKGCFFRLGCIC